MGEIMAVEGHLSKQLCKTQEGCCLNNFENKTFVPISLLQSQGRKGGSEQQPGLREF